MAMHRHSANISHARCPCCILRYYASNQCVPTVCARLFIAISGTSHYHFGAVFLHPACMACPYAHAVDRLQALRGMFDKIRDEPDFEEKTVRHAAALRNVLSAKSVIKMMKEDEEKAADIATRIVDVGFPADVEASMITELWDAIEKEKRKYTKFQDYTAIPAYISLALWLHMSQQPLGKHEAVYALMALAISLGLVRHLS